MRPSRADVREMQGSRGTYTLCAALVPLQCATSEQDQGNASKKHIRHKSADHTTNLCNGTSEN